MNAETAGYFGKREEEFIGLLTDIGTRKNAARILVFLTRVPQATSREIELVTHLRQSEICGEMKFLQTKKWVTNSECKGEGRGRPTIIYRLAKPVDKIMDIIREEKVKETRHQLALAKKLRDYI